MKIYISGPIFGYESGNLENFNKRAVLLEAQGHETLLPHDIDPDPHDGDCPVGYATNAETGHTSACHLRADIREMLGCDAVALLHGWTRSQGASFEVHVATMCGLPVYLPGEAPEPNMENKTVPRGQWVECSIRQPKPEPNVCPSGTWRSLADEVGIHFHWEVEKS